MSANEYFSMTTEAPTSASIVSVDTTAGGTVLVSSNTNRKEVIIQNNGTEALIIRLGGNPATDAYHFILSASTGARDGTGGFIVIDFYQGEIKGIVEANSTAVSVMEIVN